MSRPDPPRPMWLRISVAGIVRRRVLGPAFRLDLALAPPYSILRIESDESAGELAATLRDRGLDVLSIRRVA